jgi:hypothetical protein
MTDQPRAPRLLQRGLLLFWALYFTLVLSSNFTDALKALGVLDATFPFASGNYALVHKVTQIYSAPTPIVAAMFAGVLAWELAAAVCFWIAFTRTSGASSDAAGAATTRAFLASISLWATFILMDEFFIAFEIPGLESTHMALFVAELVTLIALWTLGRRAEREPA